MNPAECPSPARVGTSRGERGAALDVAPQESPETTALRLIASIDEIMAQETIWLRAGNCVRAAAASSRASPLISRLGELAAAHPAAVATVGFRVGALLAGRRENQSTLSQLKANLTAERARLAEARGRVQAMIPTYARQASVVPRPTLNAAV
jgi:hypothetical protein